MHRVGIRVGNCIVAIAVLLAASACGESSDGNGGGNSTSTQGTSAGGFGGDGGTGGDSATSAETSSSTSAGDGGSGGTAGGGGSSSTNGGTGGSTGTGGSDGTGGAAGTAGTGAVATGAVATLGDPCDSPGALACAGNHQKVTLLCGTEGEWEVNQTCSGDQFCDTGEGANAGSCQDAAPGCEGEEPGFQLCDGDALVACGPDTVDLQLVEECDSGCLEGACNNPADPCPEEGTIVDCAGDCDPEATCGTDCPRETAFITAVDPPITVRVPDYRSLCSAACDPSSHVLAFTVGSSDFVRVQTPPPWHTVADIIKDEVAVCDNSPLGECAIVDLGYYREFYVFSDDPTAGASNVTFEVVDEDATCP